MPFKIKRNAQNEDEVDLQLSELLDEKTKAQLAAGEQAAADAAAAKTLGEQNQNALAAIQATLARISGGGGNNSDTDNSGDGNGVDNNGNNANSQVMNIALTAHKTSLDATIMGIKREMADELDAEGKPKYPYFSQFREEMEKLTEKDALQWKANKSYWDNAYHIVQGRHLNDIISGKIKASNRHFVEAGGATGSPAAATDKSNEPSDIDILQAKKWKMPIEKYMESKKALKFV